MKIIVCIKQVPDTSDIKWTENNTLKRDEMDSIINPFDEFALETALRIKDIYPDSSITTISMGPKQAEKSLYESLALGADNSILLCDKKFAAADTVATSRTIASAINKRCNDFDLIICGQFATDGDTAQTGVGIAESLHLPQITYVKNILEIKDNEITVEKEDDYGIATLKVKLPALICMQKCDYDLRQAKIKGYITARNKSIKTINLDNLDINENQVGLKGSATYVKKAFKPEINKQLSIIDGSIDEKAKELSNILKELKQDE